MLQSYIERTSDGIKESNPYNKLHEEQIVFLSVQVDDASASDVIGQLLHLEHDNPDRDITFYINSPGGSFTALMAIYDTMQYVRPDIATYCLGKAAPAAAVLPAGGARVSVRRYRTPEYFHQPSTEGIAGYVSDVEIQAEEIQRARQLLETRLAHHTGKPVTDVRHDIERERILTADEAHDYGMVDEVLCSLPKP